MMNKTLTIRELRLNGFFFFKKKTTILNISTIFLNGIMIKFNRINNNKLSIEYILPLKTVAKNEEIIFSL